MSPNVNARGVALQGGLIVDGGDRRRGARIASGARPHPRCPPTYEHAGRLGTYGSGNFGRGASTRPGCRRRSANELDQTADPRAQQAELGGGTEAQHQVGNDPRRGRVQSRLHAALEPGPPAAMGEPLGSGQPPLCRRLPGWLLVDVTARSTLFLDRRPARPSKRDFGVGYVRKALHVDGIDAEQVTYAPFGDDPLLLDDVTITNGPTRPGRCRGSSTGTRARSTRRRASRAASARPRGIRRR